MIARLFNAPTDAEANTIGTSTIGSSEAIMVRYREVTTGMACLAKYSCSWVFSP